MNDISIYRFPFHFDATALQDEVSKLTNRNWISHFNTHCYSGEWNVIPLRSVDGNAETIFPDPTGKRVYADTIYLEELPYIKHVIGFIPAKKLDVRLMNLAPNSVIKKHRDYNLEFSDGEVRLHVPVFTNNKVEFILDDVKVEMKEGECWYLNFNKYHSVANYGSTPRIHLVIDCIVSDELINMIETTETIKM
jgi:mannose-6-phosphate isomerase-like protein (cupin superfamily)